MLNPITQAGDTLSALRCLIAAGDLERLITFVGLARNPAVYVAAADYLTTLDWSNDPSLVKHIVSMYSKVGWNGASVPGWVGVLEKNRYKEERTLCTACTCVTLLYSHTCVTCVSLTLVSQGKAPEKVATFLVMSANVEIMKRRKYGSAAQVLSVL